VRNPRPSGRGGCQLTHPLPLLTATSNNPANDADYCGRNQHMVGTWAFKTLEVVTREDCIPKDYVQLAADFCWYGSEQTCPPDTCQWVWETIGNRTQHGRCTVCRATTTIVEG